jgi:hypothetical protein
VPERAARAQAAGCDLALNCWAKMDDMVGIAQALAPMGEQSAARLDRALGPTAAAAVPRDVALQADLSRGATRCWRWPDPWPRAALADEDLWEGLPEVSGAVSADEALYLELDGWEGPLDLLLELARRQKVDLRGFRSSNWSTSISTISTGPKLKLELAADYLVMAAWLAYLKSLLLLPRDPACSPARKNWRCACNCGCSGWARCARRARG